MGFCPQWVFDVCCARAAQEFISLDMDLETYAKKYEKGLSEHYEIVSYSLVSEAAEEMLRFLDEIDEEAAFECLHSFIFSRTKFESKGKVRKLKSLLSTAVDPERDLNFYPNVTTKNFRGFVFSLRSKNEFFAPDGWNISDEEHIDWLAELINQELSLFNSI